MAKNKFAVGDKVRFVDRDGALKHNEIYTVRALHPNYSNSGIEVEGHPGWHYEFRFELARSSRVQVLPATPQYSIGGAIYTEADARELYEDLKKIFG